jgi:phosphoribosylamine--glycine ligase
LNILVIGSGGREHSIVWKLKQSSKLHKIYCAPGNAGIASQAECLNTKADDIYGLLEIVRVKKIDLTIVGPEIPLSLGIVNLFEKYHYPIFGPTQEATEIESSKVFAKYIMDKYHIPTARYRVFEDDSQALAYLREQSFPLVLKADGLAGGKGVLIVQNRSKAEEAISQIMKEKKFGKAGNRVVIEEFLSGEEVSMLVFTDGKHFLPMVLSQDHKKIEDNDLGPNTGGMGAYSPLPFVGEEKQKWVLKNIFQPVILGMEKEGRTFKGVLYAGLILTDEGPKVLEFNARFGDPETQVILPALETDLVEIVQTILGGSLDQIQIQWSKQSSVCIVIASEGYPGHYQKGKIIHGLEELENKQNIMVFHAGTRKRNDEIITCGGRVLGVTAWADTLPEAIKQAYEGAEKIHFEGKYYRRDIGKKGLHFSNGNT